MFATLGALSRLVATPPKQATTETVLAACELVRELLSAEDAYVIRAGDPAFIRLGCEDDPTTYEIKQRGYWHAWRDAAARAEGQIRMFSVNERIVSDVRAPEPGIATTHLAAVLPGDESNSEMLIVRGPWANGLNADQVSVIETITPLMAYLVANVLDKTRHERLRSQMRVFADIASAFSREDVGEGALGALATALARASGFAWVPILLFDPALEHVVDRALNTSRHSNTEIAIRAQEGRQSEHSVERDIRVARRLAWTRQPHFVPDLSDRTEQFLVDDELRPYYESAHVLSMAVFPVLVKDTLIGTITFSGAEHHDFDQQEQEFLGSLVAQAGPTIHAFTLNRELRLAEQRLRAVFSNAPVFITVFEPDGRVALSEGAGLMGLGQRAGEMVGQCVYDIVPSPFNHEIRQSIERGLQGENFDTNMHFSGRDFETRYAPLKDEEGVPTGVIGVTLDVSERYRARRELEKLNEELHTAKESAEALARQAEASRQQAEYLASHDALTGVLSRRAWFELGLVNKPTAIAVFDVDSFKSINDEHGHPAGDSVLREVAERLTDAVDGMAIIGRLGGEEFGMIFNGPLEEAERACARAVEHVAAAPYEVPSGASLRVTVSAGLAPCRRALDRPEAAIDRAYECADQALYQAKEAGRHRLVVAKAA
jgi:diguanylate cyclase (GGDEF)-like protein/PAS domain S-box-containing protein